MATGFTRQAQRGEGATPLIALEVDVADVRRVIWLKLESSNVRGSIKDRTAAALWSSVRARVHPEEGVIESTSGNLGIALAAICAGHGIPFTAVVEPRISRAAVDMMRRDHARIVMIDRLDARGGYLLNRLAYVHEQLQARPQLIWTNQYENPANPQAHRTGTAPELWRQLPRPATVLVAVSTGGTLAGFRQFSRSEQVPWDVVGVDVEGSVALGEGVPGPRVLPGIGSSRPTSFLPPEQRPPREVVSSAEAVATCLWLAEQTGIMVGGSSGAVLAAALRRIEGGRDETDLVVVCPDGGDRYQDTIYSPAWRQDNIATPGLVRPVKLMGVRRRTPGGAR
ncbi:pyridoxal-phosphate dependent enzyme [Nocardia brasiliensis]|uniref:pyridoxal-phosphate dependent enzyme n=1 Tax=Nocardia brasiliensis TaxID=37326 RepID=UPI00366FF01D